MTIEVRYFASLRESLGACETVAAVEGETAAELRRRLAGSSPKHAEALAEGRLLRCAVDHTLCDPAQAVPDGAEVAFFPPVTGG